MTTAATKAAESGRIELKLQSYFQMTKPTISLLVMFTALPTMFMTSRGLPDLGLMFAILFGTYLASSSSAIFNHVLDSDIDATMTRTRKRPMVQGAVNPEWAIVLAVTLGAASFCLLTLAANPLTAWVALLANWFYVVVYTLWLKRRTPQNIVIGGAAGAVGPLIGWAGMTGSIGWEAWVLFLVIFLWTPPHFWALAIKYKDDYSAANIPMLPSVKGLETTRRQIFLYTLLLIPTTLSLFWFGGAHIGYLVASLGCSLYFSYLAFRLLRSRKLEHAMPVFLFSLVYIFAIFGVLAIEEFLYLL